LVVQVLAQNGPAPALIAPVQGGAGSVVERQTLWVSELDHKELQTGDDCQQRFVVGVEKPKGSLTLCREQFRELGGLRGSQGGFDSRPCVLRQAVGLIYRRSPPNLVERGWRRASNSASTPAARSMNLRVAAGACPGPTA